MAMAPFKLNDKFVTKFKDVKPPFGFNGLGELVYMRTYSRLKEDGNNEKWWETVQRVVEGTYNIQKDHIEKHSLGWNNQRAHKSAKEMFERIFHMKFLPPGRGLWAMGTNIIKKRGLAASLNNCSFVSTGGIGTTDQLAKPFCFLMDMCMLGVGVGFDTKGEGGVTIKAPNTQTVNITIEDTREGWVESVDTLVNAYQYDKNNKTVNPIFDYSDLRAEGIPLKTFGGISSGPRPLIELHESITIILNKNINKVLSVTTIVDIMNLIGKCVVAGNVRRTAEIAFGEYDSVEFMDLKNYEINPDRATFGWTSNNSIFAELGMDYCNVAKRIKLNGEPGLCWLDNMRQFSRMDGSKDNKDSRVCGGNPCLEQSLESYELCCLVETFPSSHESLKDFIRTLKYAFLYAKTVTLGLTHWPETNRVQLRNRRIGCSVTGIAQFLTKHNIDTLRQWLQAGYKDLVACDIHYSEWFAIPRSIKMTSVKPSGTVSLLAGATPGMHYPESRFYIRRMRLAHNSALVIPLKEAGYHVEPAFGSERDTVVVEIPVDVGEGIRTINEVSMWEQLSLAAFLQENWSDNQVSCTVTFNPTNEGDQIEKALNYYQYKLKGISFLPKMDSGAFPQMPYEEISESKYNEILGKITEFDFNNSIDSPIQHDGICELFCDGDACLRG